MARGVRTASGWSFAKFFWRIIWWVPPLTPIGIWMSLRHHRWKGQQKTERRMRQMMEEQERKKG